MGMALTGMTMVTRGMTKIDMASPEVIEVTRRGLSAINGSSWLDCRGFAKSIAERGGNKDLSYEVSVLIPDLARLGLIEYQWIWDRGRRIHYRSTSTESKFSAAISGGTADLEGQDIASACDAPPVKEKKKKRPVCCEAQDLFKMKSGRKKCRNCGKKFGKKKKNKPKSEG